ncbi:hypothetical protein BB558_003664 [Smittium angustum]|uniref:Uncharacterized protein n=1 Tax=Smittium angustum TaxID=133377 RepID=A0A2U1J5C7_SMIAN|nr:hypothetical protein BB558_003664 [Smittium angustum]
MHTTTKSPLIFDYPAFENIKTHVDQEIYILQWLSSLESFLQKTIKTEIDPVKEELVITIIRILFSTSGVLDLIHEGAGKLNWLTSSFDHDKSFKTSFSYKPSRNIRDLAAKSLVRIFEIEDMRQLPNFLDFLQKCFSTKNKWFEKEYKCSALSCVGIISEALSGSAGFALLSYLNDFIKICMKTAKSSNEPVIVRTEAVVALGRIIIGGNKAIEENILNEILKTLQSLINQKCTLLSISSMKTLQILSEYTELFKSPNKANDVEKLISGTLMKMVSTRVLSVKKALSKLIVSLIISFLPTDLPTQWDLSRELYIQITEGRSKNFISNFSISKPQISSQIANQTTGNIIKSKSIDLNSVEANSKDFENNIESVKQKIHATSSEFTRISLGNDGIKDPRIKTQTTMDPISKTLRNDKTSPTRSTSIENQNQSGIHNIKADEIKYKLSGKNDWSLNRALKLLSSYFVKHTCTREERTTIFEIYSNLFEKLGSQYVEAHYPVLVNHILVDLLGSTQVKKPFPGNDYILLGAFKNKVNSIPDRITNQHPNIELRSISLAIREIASNLLRDIILNAITNQKTKSDCLKYIHKFWVRGLTCQLSQANGSGESDSVNLSTQDFYNEFTINGIATTWEGINWGNHDNLNSFIQMAGEVGLLVTLREWNSLVWDIGPEVVGLNLFVGSSYYKKTIHEDRSIKNNNQKSKTNISAINPSSKINTDQFKVYEVDSSYGTFLALLENKSESIRLSASTCLASYLSNVPEELGSFIKYLCSKIETHLWVTSNFSDSLDKKYFDELEDILEDKKKNSGNTSGLEMNAESYLVAGSLLQPKINLLRKILGYSQGLSVIIANALSKNTSYAPLKELDWIYQISLQLLHDVYKLKNTNILSIENQNYNQIQTDKSIKNENVDSETRDQDTATRILSSDPLNIKANIGLKSTDIVHIPVSASEAYDSDENKNTIKIIFSKDSASKENTKFRTSKAILGHLMALAHCNMKMNVGWTLLSSFMSIIPSIYSISWAKTQVEHEWSVLWKKALPQVGDSMEGNSPVSQPLLVGDTKNSQYYSSINCDIRFICSTMPWPDRSHLLQSRYFAISHISSFLKLEVALSTEARKPGSTIIITDKKLKDAAIRIRNALLFVDAMLEAPSPPLKGLDLGAIGGESRLSVDKSISSGKNSNVIPVTSTLETNFSAGGGLGWLEWSMVYCAGTTNWDMQLPLIELPNAKSLTSLHHDIRFHIISSSIALVTIGSHLRAFLAPLTIKLSLHMVASSNNQSEVYQEKQTLASNQIISRAISVYAKLQQGTTAAMLNDTFKRSKSSSPRTFLSGFKGGSWNYEAEVGETSLLRRTVEHGSSITSVGHDKRSKLLMSYGLDYGTDFNKHHFTSIDYSHWHLICPEPEGYKNKLPVVFEESKLSDPTSLNEYTRLVDVSIQFLGMIFNSLEENTQIQLLQELLNRMQRLPYNSHRQAAIMSNYLTVMYATIKVVLVHKNKSLRAPTDHSQTGQNETLYKSTLSNHVAAFMSDVACSALIIPSSTHRLFASEILGILSLASDKIAEYLTPLIDRLMHQAIRSRDRFSRAGTALALSSIYAHAGSIAASIHLQKVVVMLISLANDPDSLVHMWALRALSEAIISAGFMFERFGKETLQMIIKLFMSDTHSYPFVGECMNTDPIRQLPLFSTTDYVSRYDSQPYQMKISKSQNLPNEEAHKKSNFKNTDKEGGKTTPPPSNRSTPNKTVALGHNAAFYHPNSITHKFENSNVENILNLSGSAALSMGIESDWTKTCCEDDLDAFDARVSLGRVLNSFVTALGPTLKYSPEMLGQVLTLVSELLKTSQSMGFGKATSFGMLSVGNDIKVLSEITLAPNTKIFSLSQSVKFLKTLENSSLLKSPKPTSSTSPGQMFEINGKMIFVVPASTLLQSSHARSVMDLYGNTGILAEAIFLLQQQQMFFQDITANREDALLPKLYTPFYTDQVIELYMRPIIRSFNYSNGLYDGPILNGIRNLQITTVNTLETLVRLYGEKIIEDNELFVSNNSDSKTLEFDDKSPLSWIRSCFTSSSAMLPLLGWSWSDILFDSFALHNSVKNSGSSHTSSGVLINSLEQLCISIVDNTLRNEENEIRKVNTSINLIYGMQVDQSEVDDFLQSSAFSKYSKLKYEDIANESLVRLESINLINSLISIVTEKHQKKNPRLNRKGLDYGQWTYERTDDVRASDSEWLSIYEIGQSNSNSTAGLSGNVSSRYQNTSDVKDVFSSSSQILDSSDAELFNNQTRLFAINLIIRILKYISKINCSHKNEHKEPQNSTQKQKTHNVHILSNILSDLITSSYIAANSSAGHKSLFTLSGIHLMQLLIDNFVFSIDIAMMEKLDRYYDSKRKLDFSPSSVLELYEAQIKSTIMPIVNEIESLYIFEDKDVFSSKAMHQDDINYKNIILDSNIVGLKALPDEPIECVSKTLSLGFQCICDGVLTEKRTQKRILNVLWATLAHMRAMVQGKSLDTLIHQQAVIDMFIKTIHVWNDMINYLWKFYAPKSGISTKPTDNDLFSDLQIVLSDASYSLVETCLALLNDISSVLLYKSIEHNLSSKNDIYKMVKSSSGLGHNFSILFRSRLNFETSHINHLSELLLPNHKTLQAVCINIISKLIDLSSCTDSYHVYGFESKTPLNENLKIQRDVSKFILQLLKSDESVGINIDIKPNTQNSPSLMESNSLEHLQSLNSFLQKPNNPQNNTTQLSLPSKLSVELLLATLGSLYHVFPDYEKSTSFGQLRHVTLPTKPMFNWISSSEAQNTFNMRNSFENLGTNILETMEQDNVSDKKSFSRPLKLLLFLMKNFENLGLQYISFSSFMDIDGKGEGNISFASALFNDILKPAISHLTELKSEQETLWNDSMIHQLHIILEILNLLLINTDLSSSLFRISENNTLSDSVLQHSWLYSCICGKNDNPVDTISQEAVENDNILNIDRLDKSETDVIGIQRSQDNKHTTHLTLDALALIDSMMSVVSSLESSLREISIDPKKYPREITYSYSNCYINSIRLVMNILKSIFFFSKKSKNENISKDVDFLLRYLTNLIFRADKKTPNIFNLPYSSHAIPEKLLPSGFLFSTTELIETTDDYCKNLISTLVGEYFYYFGKLLYSKNVTTNQPSNNLGECRNIIKSFLSKLIVDATSFDSKDTQSCMPYLFRTYWFVQTVFNGDTKLSVGGGDCFSEYPIRINSEQYESMIDNELMELWVENLCKIVSKIDVENMCELDIICMESMHMFVAPKSEKNLLFDLSLNSKTCASIFMEKIMISIFGCFYSIINKASNAQPNNVKDEYVSKVLFAMEKLNLIVISVCSSPQIDSEKRKNLVSTSTILYLSLCSVLDNSEDNKFGLSFKLQKSSTSKKTKLINELKHGISSQILKIAYLFSIEFKLLAERILALPQLNEVDTSYRILGETKMKSILESVLLQSTGSDLKPSKRSDSINSVPISENKRSSTGFNFTPPSQPSAAVKNNPRKLTFTKDSLSAFK